MDEFKPEDELKPDASDRRPSRPRKSSTAAKTPVSRQRIMMGVGILVLLLLVLGIGSALNGPDEKKPATAGTTPAANGGSGSEKNIDLGGSSSLSGGQTPPSDAQTTPATSGDAASNPQRDISMPPVASTPTQAAPVDAPANQQRVTLPGDLNSALTNQQQQVDSAAMGTQSGSSLPTAPATVSGNAGTAANPVTAPSVRQTPNKSNTAARSAHDSSHKTASKPVTRDSKTHTTPARTPVSSAAAGSSSASKSLPGGSYTLQLSGASKPESLNAWAKQQNLSGYHVYKTTRNGQSWYVLVSGSYATPADAKRAVASLPADVRAKNPWVKPVSQVKKEASQ
ncbi:SPOR domain-containing protein [Pantoea sp. Bo_2]|uniref:Cell division protein DamX n=1 Tax=Candidatus Pantoea gossypiicola TaxID=2608008 RepID=A0AB34CJ60_9GAMM|nr:MULTISPECIES: SPOR domain-containing protein [Pantoea]KAA5930885.1 SPOR domain-containing protein [Pantoea sp. VH_8]KAA5935552.1 SPOR domain-containing protein [Pantoea sp. VH_4]KAA5948670.1 SPOR domain-containing protein [Pantoea sp. VH_3]KAA5955053.1 SPOR domain-containing protein [Pantoea sp. VH_25]KAA5957521.1 SPOR domain-containing protein [Pantoea sp. VH_24]